jgi:hypothetical protein
VARAAGVSGVDIDGLCAYCNSWLRCMVYHGGRSWENNGDGETGLIRLAAREVWPCLCQVVCLYAPVRARALKPSLSMYRSDSRF